MVEKEFCATFCQTSWWGNRKISRFSHGRRMFIVSSSFDCFLPLLRRGIWWWCEEMRDTQYTCRAKKKCHSPPLACIHTGDAMSGMRRKKGRRENTYLMTCDKMVPQNPCLIGAVGVECLLLRPMHEEDPTYVYGMFTQTLSPNNTRVSTRHLYKAWGPKIMYTHVRECTKKHVSPIQYVFW